MNTKKIAYYGVLTSIMLVLGLVERQLILVPGIPGIRLGLSNSVLLYALCLFSAGSAWLLMGLKVLLGGLLYAGVSGLFYSMAGGVLSMAAMTAALWLPGVGLVGVSVLGAVAHMAGQLIMCRLLLGNWAVAIAQAPLLMGVAVITGILTGIAAHSASNAIARINPQMAGRLKALGFYKGGGA